MKYVEFMNRLIKDQARGIYLIDSEDDYLTDTIINQAKSSLSYQDINLTMLKDMIEFDQIKNSYETYPFMEDKKVIIWKDIDLSKNNIKKYEEILNALIDDIDDFPKYCLFLIISDEKPFKGKFYKKIEKKFAVVKIERLTHKELVSFIGKRFKRNNKKIQISLIERIIDRFSYLNKKSEISLYEVVNTIDKIISNSNNEIVNKEDVDIQLDKVLDLNIFNFTDKLSIRDQKKSMDIFISMLDQDFDIFMIYHMIIRHIRNLLAIKLLIERGYNDSFIQKTTGISTYELNKDKGFINNFKKEELIDIIDFLYKIEDRQKSEDFDLKLNLTILISKYFK